MNINTKLSIGQIVYLKEDEKQQPHIIKEIRVMPQNCIQYIITGNNAFSSNGYYDFELSSEKDIMKIMNDNN